MLLGCVFTIGIKAELREIDTDEPGVRRFVYTGKNLDNGIKSAYAASYNKKGEVIKHTSKGISASIEVYNNAYFNNHSSATASASTPQGLSSPEIKPPEQLESQIMVPLFDCVKHNLAAIFAGAASAAGIIYWVKIKYHFYSLLQRCVEVEKWSKWKNLNLLKSLVSAKKFENTLIVELEQQYATHDDVLNAFSMDIDRELLELEKLLKECIEVKDSMIVRFFVPIDKYLQEAEHKREALNYLKKVVHEILNDFGCETVDNGCADFFLFD